MTRTKNAPLLIEIGCEEIPARMIPGAAGSLAERVVAVLDQAGLAHGATRAWGGSRRLAVQVEEVEERQRDREQQILGPPATIAFGEDGTLTRAGEGFARKQGVEPSILGRVTTDKGVYAGFIRSVSGKSVSGILCAEVPSCVDAMSFPKTMRWAEGRYRWVRPVHWVVALYGDRVVPIELYGVTAGSTSRGHRFLGPGTVEIRHPDEYLDALRAAFVVVDPSERRDRLAERLAEQAAAAGRQGRTRTPTALVPDERLLDEVADLVEWPGVVAGRFAREFLDELPAEIVETTLRHHQKAFSVGGAKGPFPAFLSVSNMENDPAGHIRRGNEWVVQGRLDDALFFWREDRTRPLADRLEDLARVTFESRVGTYADKTAGLVSLAERLVGRLGLGEDVRDVAREAARVAKCDLVTGLVGEFPELQGIMGGLLLRAEGADRRVADAVYDHYRPAGPDDAIPSSEAGCVVSVADKLDSFGSLIAVGEVPRGSRDPFGLRRALNGVFRIVNERGWPISLGDLADLIDASSDTRRLILDRYGHFLRERGYTLNEIQAVLRPKIDAVEATTRRLDDLGARLDAIKTLRGREDFEHLVDLTKRVDNILTKGGTETDAAPVEPYREDADAAVALEALVEESSPEIRERSSSRDYLGTVEVISRFVAPVDRFFDEVLVLDEENPAATRHRCALLSRVRDLLTSCFDIRELAGQAEGRSS